MQSFLPADESLQLFLADLITDKYGKDIDPMTASEYKEDLLPRLTKWIMLKTMTEIAKHSPKDLQTLEQMAKDDKPAKEVQTFIQHIIPDSASFLTKTLTSFRQAYLGTTT